MFLFYFTNRRRNKNFSQGVPQKIKITQPNKKRNLYIENNNNKKTHKYIKFLIVFYEISYFEIIA